MVIKHIKTAVVFGTFDIIHEGHLNFFKQAKKAAGSGSRLVVVVARDSNVIKEKGRPAHDEKTRLSAVKKLDIVDEAMLGSEIIDFSIINSIRPDIIALGYDQALPQGFDTYIKDKKINVVRLKPYNPEKFKSSILKNNPKPSS
ncbi:MAG: adenylyltransferase/cytidyltransferase family protein [Nanoarchaeota archaeon]|nr:adenylyltransferase/cytidyltransferase family protein [Nanoarchaeota archaeon]